MFDSSEYDFTFDWLVKRFHKENIVNIFNRYSRNCFIPCFFYKRVKIPCRLSICVSDQFSPGMS